VSVASDACIRRRSATKCEETRRSIRNERGIIRGFSRCPPRGLRKFHPKLPRKRESGCRLHAFLARSTYSNIRFLRDPPGNDSCISVARIGKSSAAAAVAPADAGVGVAVVAAATAAPVASVNARLKYGTRDSERRGALVSGIRPVDDHETFPALFAPSLPPSLPPSLSPSLAPSSDRPLDRMYLSDRMRRSALACRRIFQYSRPRCRKIKMRKDGRAPSVSPLPLPLSLSVSSLPPSSSRGFTRGEIAPRRMEAETFVS